MIIKLISLIILFTGIFCQIPKTNKRILSISTLNNLKSKATWQPYEIHENPLNGLSRKSLKNYFGVELTYTRNKFLMLADIDDHIETFDIPNAFDSRENWPECISQIRKQEHCGSCWAFSASTTLSDRFCISSKGKIKPLLSPQYLLSCDHSNNACKGGLLDKVWEFLESSGTTNDSCNPYVSGDGKIIPECTNACTNKNGSEKFKLYKAKKNSSKPLTCALQIQREIIENGPVQTGFEVYEDFLHYKSGIYTYTDGIILGGHAVKIVGWGKENEVNYWIVANSWGSEWGEKGYFRIAFGECSIDKNAYTGKAEIGSFSN